MERVHLGNERFRAGCVIIVKIGRRVFFCGRSHQRWKLSSLMIVSMDVNGSMIFVPFIIIGSTIVRHIIIIIVITMKKARWSFSWKTDRLA
jgi:hypothetical protein